ncbi:ABC transporter ATP-binding protein [Clostridium intestinale]|jgi:putative ABC transport system ATP-binding protein|uniref:ABC transporter ATP-binding protein n=1 Tax=Clostridium intestinale URNW TaxID=1294142 RepID=U2N0E6_9CLOT|nr:ABC transporter ATP-binding protein [Clostridium intestinale]ERK28967.1 ABC transporter ATP-binding protein [Clostridium intestinale URNW]
MELIKLKDIKKIYTNKSYKTNALDGVSLNIKQGEIIAIMGPSGSGKSTLLNILGLIDIPSEGEYYLKDKPLSDIRKNKVHKTRNLMIGFVFQYFALLKDYTALENVVLPLNYRKLKQKDREAKAKTYLEKVGLKEHMNKTPDELSGGQQQRVAIARALVGEPELILADEPTGNLDRKTGEEIINLLLEINKEGKTIVIVTHDIEIAKKCNRILEIVDGKLA